jgi:hypothetical protein
MWRGLCALALNFTRSSRAIKGIPSASNPSALSCETASGPVLPSDVPLPELRGFNPSFHGSVIHTDGIVQVHL